MKKKSLDTIISVKPDPQRTGLREKKKPVIKKQSNKNAKKLLNNLKCFLFDNRKLIISLLVLFVIGGIILRPIVFIGKLYSLVDDGKYLVLFQNNAELRGGGGFLGTFAVVDIKDKKVRSYYFEANIYKKDNEFKNISPYRLPKYLAEELGVDAPMGLRDANYSADFPEAAQKVMELYNFEYQDEVDGVVAVNATVMKNLLKITGPIKVPGEEVILSEDNFFDVSHEKIQYSYFLEDENKQINEPKNLLKSAVAPILKKAKSSSPVELYGLLKSELKQKNILFYFNDSKLQAKVEKNNWGGEIKRTSSEYLFISNTNVTGGKSSLSVRQNVGYKIPDNKSGQRVVSIEREHFPNNFFESNVPNKNYTRVYLPKDIQLNAITRDKVLLEKGVNYDFMTENDKTVVGLWTNTKLGEKMNVKIDFTLPPNISNNYLYYQKQPGAKPDHFTIDFKGRNLFTNHMEGDQKIDL